MQQYLEIKKSHPDSILFFRLGDFYEMFFEDAVTAAPLLEVQLTSRDKSSSNPIPMCGIPYHAASNYLQKLIQKGYKVAICEQTEVPVVGKTGKTIIKREVARVVTPALVGDPDLVAENQDHLLIVIHPLLSPEFEVAHLDLLGGDLRIGRLSTQEELFDFVARAAPKEFLLDPIHQEESWLQSLKARFPRTLFTFREGIFGSGVVEATRCYVRETTQQEESLKFLEPQPLAEKESLHLDSTALHALEILKSQSSAEGACSLLSVLDQCLTPMGRRNLKNWLSSPLLDLSAISERHGAVESLMNQMPLYQSLKTELSQMRDLERLTTKTALGLSMPRDLLAIREVLKSLPEIKNELKKSTSSLLNRLGEELNPLTPILKKLEESLKEELPATLKEGGIFKDDYREEIAELRSLVRDAKSTIAQIEAREREATGIPSLKIKFSKVFGYTFEVTSAHLKKIPAHFQRKQTIANGERFVSEELKKFEEKVLTAESRLKQIEEQLFLELRKWVSAESFCLLNNAKILADLDCLLSFAKISRERGYRRPQMHSGWDLKIQQGRHPVVETKLNPGSFVPNSIVFDSESCRTLLITGPNMAGKSTIMRQVALMVIMAQAGCFVPAAQAFLPIVDSIFTRIGSSDDLSRGQSTFMVEMTEVAKILSQATPRSLLVIDEIGRGTSTYDGLSLAWAILEHIHKELGAKTLFATHFHELTSLENRNSALKNANVLVKKENKQIIFLHQLELGSCNKSYGIEVARLAGLPPQVLDQADEILGELEVSGNEKNHLRSKVLEISHKNLV